MAEKEDEKPEHRHRGGPAAGMTLRDHFAGLAMQAELITTSSDATPESAQALVEAAMKAGRRPEQQIAFNAYLIADAMIAERKKP